MFKSTLAKKHRLKLLEISPNRHLNQYLLNHLIRNGLNLIFLLNSINGLLVFREKNGNQGSTTLRVALRGQRKVQAETLAGGSEWRHSFLLVT